MEGISVLKGVDAAQRINCIARRIRFFVPFLTLSVLSAKTSQETEVSCLFLQTCILPCSFQGDPDAAVHWIWETGAIRVHSYFYNQDQLTSQGQRFRGRTSLFKDQVSRGNASLQLELVEINDQGTYVCTTSTIRGIKSLTVNLKVDAPVSDVKIQQVEKRITCRSEGIYPEPELTWSTSPPSTVTFTNTTTVRQSQQQLYSISSYLLLSDSVADLDYSCSVSNQRNMKRATLRKQASVSISGTDIAIPCGDASFMAFSLVWSFNNSQIILNQTRPDLSYQVSDDWRQQVKSLSQSGSLVLHNLPSNREGMYTCELRDAEETFVTNTILSHSESGTSVVGIILATVIVVALLIAIIMYKFQCYKYMPCLRLAER
ncbi:uncharacterized protein V6R79_024094 [Siganus canaliculatus]